MGTTEDAASRRPARPGGTTLHRETTSTSARRRRRKRRRALWPYLYALPAVALIAFGFGFPLVQVVRDSFYAGNFDAPIWVGLDNYKGVVDDPAFRTSVLNNLKLLAAVPIMLGIGLAIALVLNDRIRGARKYQAIVFLPYILPATAIGLAFSFLLQENGVLNTALRDMHLGALTQDWIGSSYLAIGSVGALVIWQQLGFCVVVFTAALLALPPETAEAARIDGAGWWALQRRVLVPQIRPIVELLAVIQVITVLAWVFNYVYILTAGGPGYASSVMELYIWRSFSSGANGTAASVAVMLLGMASVLIGLSVFVRRRAIAA
jgi:ABC-type sugar transport system permease subunit